MRDACTDSSCTYNVTRVCVRGHPPDDCPNRPVVGDDGATSMVAADREEQSDTLTERQEFGGLDLGAAVLRSPTELPTLPASRTLGISQANAMMESRPTCMVGIVGLPGAGKTACLVSAYLLLAKDQFDGFSFADSDTLRAFEEISRGSRMWVKGNPPEQITAHTALSNDREAGFLHLKIRRNSDSQLFDLLLPDLPGEWSKELIDLSNMERLGFLRSSSVIWLMVDGRQFATASSVAYARYRARMLLERLSTLLGEHKPRVIVVPTWQDAGQFPDAEAKQMVDRGAQLGFKVEMAPIASFSWNDAISPGEGVAKLIVRSITAPAHLPEFWPVTPARPGERAIAAFRETL